ALDVAVIHAAQPRCLDATVPLHLHTMTDGAVDEFVRRDHRRVVKTRRGARDAKCEEHEAGQDVTGFHGPDPFAASPARMRSFISATARCAEAKAPSCQPE